MLRAILGIPECYLFQVFQSWIENAKSPSDVEAEMTLNERLNKYLGKASNVEKAAFVAPSADIIGAVKLRQDSSVWYHCVLRADINEIIIGERSNIQDGTVVHLSDESGAYVGCDSTVGHKCTLHACAIGNQCLIGMGATVLDGAIVGDQSMIGAGSLVTKGMEIPEGSLVYGSPARVIRPLTIHERKELKKWAEKYVQVARSHAVHLAKQQEGNV
ncbi:MAG: gamma carbonic anhydrase family protein [Verrucomicrobiota bacterium]